MPGLALVLSVVVAGCGGSAGPSASPPVRTSPPASGGETPIQSSAWEHNTCSDVNGPNGPAYVDHMAPHAPYSVLISQYSDKNVPD